jgi:rhodanese-related sulfurtransferase
MSVERQIKNAVTEPPAASSREALAHFSKILSFETDCSDVKRALESGSPGFVLLDVRGAELYAAGRVEQAVSLPYRQIDAQILARYPADTLFVVYCAGPHCNGAEKAAIRLAELGRPVKKMIGGLEGWKDEGLPVATKS